METKSVREIIRIVESLSVGDIVRFEDNTETEYQGEVVEIQPMIDDQQKNYLIKGDNTTKDCVLEITYDIEGGPVKVDVSFEDNTSKEVISVEELN